MDNDTGKHLMIKESLPKEPTPKNNGSISTRVVYTNGEDVRQRVKYLTGSNSFSARKVVCKQLKGKPVEAKIPDMIKKAETIDYTPAIHKLDGYN